MCIRDRAKPEVKVKSVQQMIDYLEETFKNKKRIKNGQIVDSTTNAKRYVLSLIHIYIFQTYILPDVQLRPIT